MTTTASQARIEANRRNAQKSTGPRTPEGKARSAMNGLKHGLTAQHVVLPNEDPEAFAAEMAEWADYYRPDSPADRGTVERAVHAQWKLRRCARVETATLSERVRHAADRFDLDERARAEDLGRRLVHEPTGRFQRPTTRDPVTRATFVRPPGDDAPGLARQLRSFAQGVDWMLDRWRALAAALGRDGYWHHPESFLAIRLMGKCPEAVLEDPAVGQVILACNAAHPQPYDLTDDVTLARIDSEARPPYLPRVEALRALMPHTKAEARALLSGLVCDEIARLELLKASRLDELAEADRAGASDRAMFDDTPTGVLFRRYETACERAYLKAVADLTKTRKDSILRTEPIPEPSEAAPVTPEAPDDPEPAEAPEPSERPAPGREAVLPPRLDLAPAFAASEVALCP